MGFWAQLPFFTANWRVRDIPLRYLLKDLCWGLVVEGKGACKEFEHDNTKRPEIESKSMRLSLQNLWGNVIWGPYATWILLFLCNFLFAFLITRFIY